MSHLEPAAMQRVLRGAAGSQETESAAEHLMACERCRALAGSLLEELRVESRGGLKEGPLQLVYGLLDREQQWGVESLAAIAEWAALRRMPSQRSQRERVRMAKACHTLAFFRLVIGELKEESVWKESEFLASLALLSAEGMRQRKQITQEAHSDLQARPLEPAPGRGPAPGDQPGGAARAPAVRERSLEAPGGDTARSSRARVTSAGGGSAIGLRSMYFTIVGEITAIEVIASGPSVRRLAVLQDRYGTGRWRKLKGIAQVRLADGRLVRAEVHWYEAHGIGRKEMKIKRFLDD